ncbi:hypothetical protein [Flagellimonas okinawensis]|uniref:CarboxypepD_reg-like domain-containing protein n=1 Tax=Flagellimonas okinawensis TaxID=3031324 RepID=A0ABT5XQT3_9FLAO|nr:hypothetical protein [[Muricauda] okinawensis]MDF0708263.1 hypothetical protein [[Muricauda] okinawensis]
MKNTTITAILFLFFAIHSFSQKSIHGRITNSGDPLSNVHVSNIASGAVTTSNAEGYYEIFANPKEEISYTYIGMDTISIIVEDVTRILNVNMRLSMEELDEVQVVGRERKNKQRQLESEYDVNTNIIKSSFGFLNKETAGYSLRIIDEEELDNAPDINSVLLGRLAGVYAFCDPETDKLLVKMRSNQSIQNARGPIFDVDGLILPEVSCSFLFGNVRRIAFIPSLAGTTLYGTQGSGGVVVINTKSGTMTPREKNNKPFDQAKLRNNYLKGKVVQNGQGESLPQYLINLQNSKTIEEAKIEYGQMELVYGNNLNFILDSYVHFYEVRKEKEFADSILERFVQVSENNPVMLKAMAYTLEEEKRNEKAHEIFKKIYQLRPDYAQSYIDLANSYRNLDMPESATSLFARRSYLLDEGILQNDSLNLETLVQREIDNLFLLENSSVKIQTRKKTDQDFYNTRLVFEWSDSEAEFDLQFVNPDNQYFNWKHSLAEMPERIRSEKRLGFSMADFLLDDELLGVWKVNATYLGNKQLSPTYLKATIYKNYGSKFQSKEVKVFRLGLKDTNQHLFEFKIPSSLVEN